MLGPSDGNFDPVGGSSEDNVVSQPLNPPTACLLGSAPFKDLKDAKFTHSPSSSDEGDATTATPESAEFVRQQDAGSKTLSGATGKFLAQELAKWMQRGRPAEMDIVEEDWMTTWERAEWKVHRWYDRPFGKLFNFVYDVLQLSSGRDKLLALLQGYAKFASESLSEADSERHWMYRGVEDSLSDGRKVFRLFKEFREVYKIRRGLHRMWQGYDTDGVLSLPAICGSLDTLAHTASFFYYLFDNLLWAASVGIVRAKAIPKWQRKMWQGHRRNGAVVTFLGGVGSIKRIKNFASIWRLVFAFVANVLLLRKALPECSAAGGHFQGLDDPRLFHTLELLGMAASFRVLLSKLKYAKLKSHSRLGLLAMLAAACGIWSNWRKVVRKKCGSKPFIPAVQRRRSGELSKPPESSEATKRVSNKNLALTDRFTHPSK